MLVCFNKCACMAHTIECVLGWCAEQTHSSFYSIADACTQLCVEDSLQLYIIGDLGSN